MKYILAVCLALAAIPTVYSQQVTADKLLMISIAVRDMDKSKEFYTSALGLKITQDYSHGGQRWVSLSLPGGGASMSLLQAADTENLRPGTQKLYFTTSDAESLYEAIKAKGIVPTHEFTKQTWQGSPWAGWFSLADPDGNQVMIVQMKTATE